MNTAELPGADIIAQGLSDLAGRLETAESLLVSISAPRLQTLGFDVPSPFADAELHLYQLLVGQHGAGAHARYNALIRRIDSFQRAAACAR